MVLSFLALDLHLMYGSVGKNADMIAMFDGSSLGFFTIPDSSSGEMVATTIKSSRFLL